MKRRKILLGLISTGIPLSGCLNISNSTGNSSTTDTKSDTERSPPRFTDVSAPKLQPGEEDTLTVTAESVGKFQFRELPNQDLVAIGTDLEECTVTPMPDSGADSFPPIWYWNSPTTVTVESPVTVAPDTEPGKYTGKVEVAHRSHEEPWTTETFVVTVTDD